jgi:hypothetical protein
MVRPKAKLWIVAIEFWQSLPISPSQNIICQSKAANGILIFFVLTEAVATINWEDPLWKLIGAGRCTKLEPFEYLFLTYANTSLNVLFEFQLAACKPRSGCKGKLAVRKPRPAGKVKESAERKPRPAGKLIVLAECKPRPANKNGFAERKSRPAGNVKFAERKPRPAGNLNLELLVAAIGCPAKDSGSDFLPWHSPHWELLVAAIGCSAKDSSSDFLP